MNREPLSLAIAAALAGGCSAAPTTISSATAPVRTTMSTAAQAPSLQVMRTLLPASLTPEQASKLLIHVSPSRVYRPSDDASASANIQPPTTTPLTPPEQGATPPSGTTPPAAATPVTTPISTGLAPAIGGAALGLGAYSGFGMPALGMPAISSFYPFDYLGASWYAPYYLDAGLYFPYAFSPFWTGAYPFLASPFMGLGWGAYSYGPFGYGDFGLGALGCGCF